MYSFQFQIKDSIKAARIEATKAYNQYVEEPKMSQRRGGFDLELESLVFRVTYVYFWISSVIGHQYFSLHPVASWVG